MLNPAPPAKKVERESTAKPEADKTMSSASAPSSETPVNSEETLGLDQNSDLHQRAEMHARLQAALQQQVVCFVCFLVQYQF